MRSSELFGQLLGPFGQLLHGSPDNVEGGVFSHSQLGAFQSTVNHGSVHAMRDQIAKRGLNMPRAARQKAGG